MKRIFVFMLAAVLLVGAVPVKDVRAEDNSLSFSDAVTYMYDNYGFTYDSRVSSLINNGYFKNGTKVYYLSNYPYYVFLQNGYCYIIDNFDIEIEDNLLCFYGEGFYFNDDSSGSYNSFSSTVLKVTSEDVLLTNMPIEHEHNWVLVETAATCTASGKTWEECYECGAIQNEIEIPALGHAWEQKEEPGSCIEDSRTWEECSVCGEIQNEVVTPASGHVWIYKEEPATCTATGRSWEECGCGEKQNEMELPLAEHSWIIKKEPATCTDTGLSWEQCSVCAAEQNETELPALGHGILIYKVTKEPTVEEEGTFTRTCSVCGEIVEEGSISSIRPTPTPRPSATPRPTPTTRPTATPRPGITVLPTSTPRPSPTLGPTATPRPTNTPRPTPTPRVTPAPVDLDTINDNVVGLLGILTMILELFTVFPLNVYLVSGIVILVIGIYILLKKSIKKR